MYNKPYVILLIIVLLAVVTTPIWINVTGRGYEEIKKELAKPKGEKCIEDTEWMVANHMELLKKFREMAIREGKRIYTSETYGTTYNASISECFRCHDYENFCKKCHEYAGVSVYCWTCHTPGLGKEQ